MEKLKASELMKLGAMMSGQSYTSLLETDTGNTCAHGAMLLAAGIDLENKRVPGPWTDNEEARRLWSFMYDNQVPVGWNEELELNIHAKDSGDTVSIGNVVVALNNELHWSRERIATWLESIERKLKAQQLTFPEAELVA
jgi:hypothetical protein